MDVKPNFYYLLEMWFTCRDQVNLQSSLISRYFNESWSVNCSALKIDVGSLESLKLEQFLHLVKDNKNIFTCRRSIIRSPVREYSESCEMHIRKSGKVNWSECTNRKITPLDCLIQKLLSWVGTEGRPSGSLSHFCFSTSFINETTVYFIFMERVVTNTRLSNGEVDCRREHFGPVTYRSLWETPVQLDRWNFGLYGTN